MATVDQGAFAGRFDLGDHTARSIHFAGHAVNAARLGRSLGLADGAPWMDVLRAAAARWPADFFARIDGVFALAWQHDGVLRLFRDESGLANLFWFRAPDGSAHAASRMQSLLESVHSAGLPAPGIARRSLHEYLRLLEIAAPNTIYEGVLAVEPGQRIDISLDSLHADDPQPPRPALDAPQEIDSALSQLELLLQSAIAARLEGAKGPAAFLSGGIDSGLICALASKQHPRLQALTVGFEGTPFDESPAASRVAARLGIRHTVLRFDRTSELRALDRYLAFADQPLADPASVPTLLAFEHAREHHDAVLDGTGADEAVGGSPPRHLRVAVGWGALVPRPLRRAAVAGLRVARLASWTPLLDFEHPAEALMRWHGFTRPEIEALCGEPVSLEHTRFFRSFARHPRVAHDERWSDLVDAMTCERLNQTAAISGAPVRYPFVAIDTWRFLRGLPAPLRHRPGESKRILRMLLARLDPGAPHDAPKHGFDMPLASFLRADNCRLVREHLLDSASPLPDLLSREQVHKIGNRFVAGEVGLVFRVWALVILSGWLARHDAAH